MAFFNKKQEIVELLVEDTEIWECSNNSCNGWKRVNMSFELVPVCHFCQSEMNLGEKLLPVLGQLNPYFKK